MNVVVYPADDAGCGHHRMIWPGEILRAAGHNVDVVLPKDRSLRLHVSDKHEVYDVETPPGVDVIVLQRVTHFYLAQAVRAIRRRGIAVVIDIDDDLNAIHPDNPAWWQLHPRHFGGKLDNGSRHLHSWRFLNAACSDATLVTVSTPALLEHYASHGRGVVLNNYLADHYYGHARVDGNDIVWPASLHSHPDDPHVVGNAIARLMADGATFSSYGVPKNTAIAYGLNPDDYDGNAPKVSIHDWPKAIAQIGIGICPLNDTRFNASKSWLKPLELSAVGVPWVGSPSPEYTKLNKLGCGIIARKPKQWYRALSQLRIDKTLRDDMSVACREVADKLRLRDHAIKWIDAWSHAYDLERSGSIPEATSLFT